MSECDLLFRVMGPRSVDGRHPFVGEVKTLDFARQLARRTGGRCQIIRSADLTHVEFVGSEGDSSEESGSLLDELDQAVADAERLAGLEIESAQLRNEAEILRAVSLGGASERFER